MRAIIAEQLTGQLMQSHGRSVVLPSPYPFTKLYIHLVLVFCLSHMVLANAASSSGGVVAWGYNVNRATTVPVAAQSGVTAIAGGDSHTVALKNDGTVVAWGDNSSGQATVPTGLAGVIAIAAGLLHTVALKNDGTVVAWGANGFGQATVPAGLTGVTKIAAGSAHTVALKNDGTSAKRPCLRA